MADSARIVIVAKDTNADDFNAVSTAINESVTAADVASIMSNFQTVIDGTVTHSNVTSTTKYFPQEPE